VNLLIDPPRITIPTRIVRESNLVRILALSILGLAAFVVLAMTVLAIFLRPYYLKATSYDLSNLDRFNVTSLFYDRNGEEIGRSFVEDRILLKHAEIPDLMRQAIIATEDRRFYSHHEIDIPGLMRAVYIDMRTGKRIQGGSTITQQLAKHLIGNFEKTISRKLIETFLARRIEQAYTKSEILDYYLNRIYFGEGYYGLAAAAEGYFGKKAKDLNLPECATLASLVKAPTPFSPRRGSKSAIRRRDVVIELMTSLKMVTEVEKREALESSLVLAPEQPLRPQSYCMAWASQELRKVLNIEESQEIPQGLIVQSTLDARLQRLSEKEAFSELDEVEAKRATENPTGAVLTDGPLQAAVLIMDIGTGAVRVLIGGRDYKLSQFDRARSARRENGALLQPFLYALAFQDLNLTPASMIDASYLDDLVPDRPVPTEPSNDSSGPDKRYLMVQNALALSNKACATRIELEIGLKNLQSWLSLAGIGPSKQVNLESCWGLDPLSLSEITSLYQMLGNSGVRCPPYCIDKVLNEHGDILFQKKPPRGIQLLDPMVSRQMTLTLESAIKSGTASVLTQDYQWNTPIAGMTGYSEGYRDAWFVGYTPHTVGGVWVGYDKSIPIGSKTLATRIAMPIWGNIMQSIVESGSTDSTFQVPDSFAKVEVNRHTGVIQGPGFLAPKPENDFVYLRQDQMDQLFKTAPVSHSGQAVNWSDWLSTMYTTPSDERQQNLSKESSPQDVEIPPVAYYRLPALRGDIMTTDGSVLATMTEAQNLVLTWPSLKADNSEEELLTWVHKRLDLARDWLKQDVDLKDSDLILLYRYKRFHPILIAQHLTQEQIKGFPQSILTKEGFALQGVPCRVYPSGTTLAHVLGHLRRIQGRSNRKYEAGEVIYDDYQGAVGLESYFDKDLRGEDGSLQIETSPEGFAQNILVNSEPTPGSTLRLTIDSRVQAAIENSMEGVEKGAVVVMNVQNGDILGMVSRPTFNPNDFIPGLSAEKWQAFTKDAENPLLDRVYQQQNPPGSTFKIVTSLAAMQAQVFDPNRTIHCPGYFQVGNVHYSLPQERGVVAYKAALAHSFNTYFFDLGLRIGRDNLIQTAHEFGIGEATGFVLSGEMSGLMPDDDFVLSTHHRSMGPGDITNASVGQGDVLVTPLQMVDLLSAIANGGTLYRPRLVRQIESPKGQVQWKFPEEIIRKIDLPQQTPTLIDAMVAVTEDGTAQMAQIPGIQIAAKTGTAQVGSKTQPRQVAWLVGFLPADHPQYAFTVMIEGNGTQDLHGGSTAGPVFVKLFSKIFAKSNPVD